MGSSNENIINRKLNELQLPELEKLDKKIYEYLIKIENTIQSFENERNDLIKNYREKKINIMSITKESKIARQTIYNHRDVLEKYIIKSQKEQEQNDVFAKIYFLYSKINKLEHDIYLLQLRDVNIEKMKHENLVLLETIKNNNTALRALEKHNKQLIDRVSFLEKEVYKSNNKLITLNDKKKFK